jgi:nudix-type nucleoside diphosphatase (YffH/AdpP family)
MTDPTKIIRRQTISRGFAHVERIMLQRQRRDGTPVELEREIMDAGDGAVILPYDRSRGTIILIRQFRAVVFLKEGRESLLETCAGKLDGADPWTRIIKETEEETGIRLSGPPQMLFTAYSTPGSFTERLTYFVAPYVPGDRISAGGGLAEEEEDIEVVETTLDAALGLIQSGEIVDAKTILLLYFAKATGLLDPQSAPQD